VVEAGTVTVGQGLYSNKAVTFEKALRKLCRIGAQQSRRRLLGGNIIDTLSKQRAANAVPMLIGCHHAPAHRSDAWLGMIKCNPAAAHNAPIVHYHPHDSDLAV
jgi:hypothetical protein